MSDFILIYSPFASEAEAEKVARVLLTEGLIACVNLIPGGRSLYWWNSAIEASNEVYALMKTTALMAPRAQSRLRDLHPYKIPCILTLKPEQVNEAYAQWLKSSIFLPAAQE